MNREALSQFIHDFYLAWQERNESKIPLFYDEDIRAFVDFKEITFTDIMNRLEFSKRKFSQSNYNLKDVFIDEENGKVAVRMNQMHIFRDGSGAAECEAIMLYKISDNKIKEVWMSFYPNVDYLNND